MYQVEKPLSVCWYYPSKILIYHMTHPTPFGKCIMILIQIFSSLALPLVDYLQRPWSYCIKSNEIAFCGHISSNDYLFYCVSHDAVIRNNFVLVFFGIPLFFHLISSFLLSLVYQYDQKNIHFVSFSIKRNRLFFFCNTDGCKITTSLNCLPNYSKVWKAWKNCKFDANALLGN